MERSALNEVKIRYPDKPLRGGEACVAGCQGKMAAVHNSTIHFKCNNCCVQYTNPAPPPPPPPAYLRSKYYLTR